MCLIVMALGAHPSYALVIAANRDEFHERPCEPARFWERSPQILAGRDLRAGGTWLGLTRGGRFAALTNFREPGPRKEDGPSRGALVSRFLEGREMPDAFARAVELEAVEYNGFSLLFGSAWELWFFSNRSGRPAERVQAGLHGLSNALLDEPWPKVVRGRKGLAAILAGEPGDLAERAFGLLEDRTLAEEARLPDTGVGRDLERALSPVFTCGARYGTRSSTILAVDREGRVLFAERSFDAVGRETARVRHDFALEVSFAP